MGFKCNTCMVIFCLPKILTLRFLCVKAGSSHRVCLPFSHCPLYPTNGLRAPHGCCKCQPSQVVVDAIGPLRELGRGILAHEFQWSKASSESWSDVYSLVSLWFCFRLHLELCPSTNSSLILPTPNPCLVDLRFLHSLSQLIWSIFCLFHLADFSKQNLVRTDAWLAGQVAPRVCQQQTQTSCCASSWVDSWAPGEPLECGASVGPPLPGSSRDKVWADAWPRQRMPRPKAPGARTTFSLLVSMMAVALLVDAPCRRACSCLRHMLSPPRNCRRVLDRRQRKGGNLHGPLGVLGSSPSSKLDLS